ncbi:carboxymuconolactone decarboxylase family protein [Kitasatospora kifunensis]|uniref:AhpD family alkylhydroperoxidase n=1 Tax=Kitasatospora kifunensis TaxID=58351 RepID=A0A7W7VVF9_KITKI|nr:carboxymuconolactone decarboxylase family protein [Kitasatospora kifunensis]MBB4924346.1 AhpD family alkylhydroperoxidase [Kitasatospora kifunensis]
MSRQYFPAHTLESAPTAARAPMEATTRHLGYLPAPVRSMAESPEVLTGFLELNKRFEGSTLDALAREVLVLTIATRNACHVCVAMHTARLTGMRADEALITALRAGTPLEEPRLEAVRLFTLEILATAGDASPEALDAFFAHGYTPRNALEVVLGISTYTLSTFANRLTGAELDQQLAPFAWSEAPAA